MKKKKIFKLINYIASSLGSMFVFLTLLYLYSTELFYSSVTSLGFWIFVSGVIITTFILIITTDKVKAQNTKEIEEYYSNVKEVLLNKNKTNINNNLSNKKSNIVKTDKDTEDILQLMSLNMKEIKEYYVLSKTMAKRSFLLSVIMCIFGFGIISMSIIAVFIIDISIIQSIVPVIGGAIVEVIAGTSMVVYKKSLEQLNRYYESLHNNEMYLSLVNLVDKLSNDRKDETYINIINNQLEVLKKSP